MKIHMCLQHVLQQQQSETVTEFISRILTAHSACADTEIKPAQEAMPLQALNCLVLDEKAREHLLSEDENTLDWEIVCDIIRPPGSLV